MDTATKIYRADRKGRITLPGLAGATVVVEQVSETEFRVRKAQVVPEDEMPYYEQSLNPLSDRDRDLLLELIDNPPKPAPALKRAAARHKARHG